MRAGWGLLLVLAACGPQGAEPVIDPLSTDEACNALDWQGLVGQPASALDGVRFAGPVRVVRPGMMMTMEYQPDRLNLTLDEAGWITRVSCG